MLSELLPQTKLNKFGIARFVDAFLLGICQNWVKNWLFYRDTIQKVQKMRLLKVHTTTRISPYKPHPCTLPFSKHSLQYTMSIAGSQWTLFHICKIVVCRIYLKDSVIINRYQKTVKCDMHKICGMQQLLDKNKIQKQ